MKKLIYFLLASIPFGSVAKGSGALKKEVESVYGSEVQIDDAPFQESKIATQDWG